MKKSRKLSLPLVSLILTGISVLQLTCQVEKMGLQDPPTVPIGTILSQLATVSQQTQAEAAIHSLFEKIGLGRPVQGSRYSDYIFPKSLVPVLARIHLLSLADRKNRLTLSDVFRIEKEVPEGDWSESIELDEALATLSEQVSNSIKDPETPNNAFVLAMIAQNGDVPDTFMEIDAANRLSAVQDFLFSVWINSEFQTDEGIYSQIRAIQYNIVTMKCPLNKKKKSAVKIRYMNGDQAKCMLAVKKTYKMDLKKCVLDASGCDEIDDCLDRALEKLQDQVDLCAGFGELYADAESGR